MMGKSMTVRALLLTIVISVLAICTITVLQSSNNHALARMHQGGNDSVVESERGRQEGYGIVEYKGVCLSIPDGWNKREDKDAFPFIEGTDLIEYEPADSSGAMLILSGNSR